LYKYHVLNTIIV